VLHSLGRKKIHNCFWQIWLFSLPTLSPEGNWQ
jgi:hypothetical protein